MKEFLSRNGVAFSERNVTTDDAAMEVLTRLKAMTTPVITIDGDVVVGFDQTKLEHLLNLGTGGQAS